jgi:hypothetical protein
LVQSVYRLGAWQALIINSAQMILRVKIDDQSPEREYGSDEHASRQYF